VPDGTPLQRPIFQPLPASSDRRRYLKRPGAALPVRPDRRKDL